MKIYYFIPCVTILFIFWSEYSVTNILIRQNSSGKRTFNLSSLLGFLIHPFYNSTLWTWKTLDINYPFVLSYSVFIHFILF